MNTHNKHHYIDKWGIGVSLFCAAHCAFLPLIISLIPMLGYKSLHNTYFELIIIGSSLTLACISLFPSYRKHQRKSPLMLIVLGFTSIAIGHFLIHVPYEWIPLSLGGLTIAFAHLRNWKLNKAYATNKLRVIGDEPYS